MPTPRCDPIQEIPDRSLGAPARRAGAGAGRPWWPCPFHDARNPSLTIVPGQGRFECLKETARAIEEAGGIPHQEGWPAVPNPRPVGRPEAWQDLARDLVARAAETLWSREGREALAYLRGRGLQDATIRKARLGFWPADTREGGVFPDRSVRVPAGLVIPWSNGSNIVFINVRRIDGEPRYLAVEGSRREGLYPGPDSVAVGKPLVIVEGEFDALLLGQELAGLTSVVTLGGTGARPKSRALCVLLRASRWVIATDADGAGEKTAAWWLNYSDRSRRVPPPREFGKDWSEAHQKGLDLRGWWSRLLEPTPVRRVERQVSVVRPAEWVATHEEVGEEEHAVALPPPFGHHWRCYNPYCLHKGRWWMSCFGVVNCMNCRPPAFPELVAARGDESNSPIVDPDRAQQAVPPYPF
jgi:hypothetical protein